jgi:hypothetical protein
MDAVIFSRFLSCIAALALAAACAHAPRSSAVTVGCWVDDVSLNYLRREAYFTFLERRQPQADTLRRLVSVAIQRDSLEADSEVVHDPQVCHRAATAAETPRPGERFSVLRIGRTYWVRSADRGWIAALDNNFRHVMTIVELN